MMLSIKVQNIDLEASAEYKSKENGINHLKLIRKINLSKLVIAHLNITLIRNKSLKLSYRTLVADRLTDDLKDKN